MIAGSDVRPSLRKGKQGAFWLQTEKLAEQHVEMSTGLKLLQRYEEMEGSTAGVRGPVKAESRRENRQRRPRPRTSLFLPS